MCTAGLIDRKFLFKNRDMGISAGLTEDILRGHGIYRYIGVAGHAAPEEHGLNNGINEAGVAAEFTYVGYEDLTASLKQNYPRGVIIEDILRNAGTLTEAIDIAVHHLNHHKFVGGNILINTPQGSAVIEELYPRYAVELNHSDRLVRTNHFLNLKGVNEKLDPAQYANSRARFSRFSELIDSLDYATVTPEQIKSALSDHAGGADAICRHGNAGAITVSSSVYDLENRRFYYIFGRPCENEFKVYSFD